MSVIDEVRREREGLARVLKKHAGIRKIVEELYPDSAHFIYELLQNAEDTGATKAQFTLSKTSLVFEHNGRPFDPQDIYAITDIGEGTKSNADDKIGRFGVGFKAVFAYSETPHIWSPTFSFKITDLVLPSAIDPRTVSSDRTRFEFPFNNPKKSPNNAYTEIEAGLNELAETTLLFLSHLESIRWQNATGEFGEVLRIKHAVNHFEVLKQGERKTIVSSHFLKFDQSVAGLEKQQVSVAYSLDFLPKVQSFDPKKPLAKQLKIIPAIPGRVAVFFPAAKETSGLRFHLHAPFVSELSRASIKETDANQPLFDQLATLAAASLHQIRDLGLLTADFLSALPNLKDQIPPRYAGIREAIIEEMNEQPLIPTHKKSHAPAKHLLQAEASLKKLLSTDDIEFLVDYDEAPPQWAVAPGQQGADTERFMSGLAITDWGGKEFVELLQGKASDVSNSIPTPPYNITTEEIITWLSRKPVGWHQELYAFLSSPYPKSTWSRILYDDSIIKSLRIVRLSDGHYSLGTKCFFPSDGVEHDEVLPRVDKSVYTSGKSKPEQESAKKFLEAIGVRDVGETEQVNAILKQRYVDDNFKPQKGDLKRFISLFEKEPDEAKLFTHYRIFELKNGKWDMPARAFLDQPFMDTGLSAYYDALGEKAECFALADRYKDCGIGLKKLGVFAKAVGVQARLHITDLSCVAANPRRDFLVSAPGRWTETSERHDYVITGLDKLLAKPTLELSKLVWKTIRLLPSDPDYLQAIYRKNKTVGFSRVDSQLVHHLRDAAWIPQVGGPFVVPAEALRDFLPEGFAFDLGCPWLKAICFGHEAGKKSEAYRQRQTIAKELGCELEDVDWWKEIIASGISPNEFREQYAQRQSVSQPEGSVHDPSRRERNILGNTADAPDKESVRREQSLQVGMTKITAEARAYLRAKYKNFDGQIVCQCCHKEMPFKLRDGNYFFEAVQCIEEKKTRHFQNRLALCPTCAAMYQYARETDDAEISRRIIELDAEDQAPAVEIPVRLADREYTLRFVGTHWFDLKTILSGGDGR